MTNIGPFFFFFWLNLKAIALSPRPASIVFPVTQPLKSVLRSVFPLLRLLWAEWGLRMWIEYIFFLLLLFCNYLTSNFTVTTFFPLLDSLSWSSLIQKPPSFIVFPDPCVVH